MAYTPISWATDDVDTANEPLKVIPPQEVMQTGLLRGEPMGRQWFNYILNYLLTKVDPGNLPKAQATHQVQIFAAEQTDVDFLKAWTLVKHEVAGTGAGAATKDLWYYEHTGI